MAPNPDSPRDLPAPASAGANWRSFVEYTPHYILVLDTEGCIQFFNRPLPQTRAEALTAKPLTDLFSPEQADSIREQLQHIYHSAQPGRLQLRYSRDGEYVFDAAIYPLVDNRVTTGLIVEARDVTREHQQQIALESKEKLLHTAMDTLPIVIWAFDNEGVFTFSQGSGLKVLGLEADEVVGTSVFDLYKDLPRVIDSCRRALKGETVNTVAAVQGRVFHAHYQPILNEQHRIEGVIGVASDITETAEAESQMRILSSALEQTADLVMITDREGQIEYVNPAFEQITGYTRDEVMNKKPNMLRSGKQSDEFYKKLWETILSGEPHNEVFINKRKDGSLYYEEKTITPIRNAQAMITHFVATGKDITERMRTQEQLRHMAHHDALTNLPNRTLLLDRLKHSMARARWHNRLVAVIFMDLDRFKDINDTLGHNVGDRVLVQLTQRLAGSVRAGDTVARFGGDEFAILLDDIASEQDISALAKKVLATLARPFKVDSRELFLTSSLGISIFPTDGEDSETLLRNADVAMYRAKELGRNNYQFYSNEMSARVFERLTLENSLRYALKRDEFYLLYQPQVDSRDGRIIGVEALIRWQHPELGTVKPTEFVPLLEETGLIVPVGEWILRSACNQARRWHRAGHESLFVSVNLSSRQFNSPDFINNVQSIITETGINPRRLELELTESMLMRNASKTITALDTLNEMGVRIAVDDFGTGYSSLNYLRRFPIDTLKIDRAFIRDVTEDQDDAAITTAIIVMAQSLNLTVIAEGVEDEAQLTFLQGLDCHLIQGNFFSPPADAEALTRKLDEKAGPFAKG